MDLEMIQDLLGEPNLPPPPSVQDLLPDVEPLARTPSPPPPTLACPGEHSYSKSPTDPQAEDPMEQTSAESGSQTVAALSPAADSFESFLLNLLRAYTLHQMKQVSSTSEEVAAAESLVFTVDNISPEALDTISAEQLNTLLNSNAVNYDIIHQIMAHKNKVEGREMTDYSRVVGGAEGGGGGAGGGGGVGGGGGEGKPGGGVVQKGRAENPPNEVVSALQQLQALHLSTEQLKQIQQQMMELIRTKQVLLPTDVSIEQQQQLLQSLLLRQVHTQQRETTSTTPLAVEALQKGGSNSPVTVGSTLAKLLGKEAMREEGAGRTVVMEVPPPASLPAEDIAIVLESNPMSTLDTSSSSNTSAGSAVATTPTAVTTRSGGRRKKDSKEEMKKPSQPYGIFFSAVYSSVIQANPRMSFSEASKVISMMWNAMGTDTKKQYYDQSEKQKEEYRAYLESKKAEGEAMELGEKREKEVESLPVQLLSPFPQVLVCPIQIPSIPPPLAPAPVLPTPPPAQSSSPQPLTSLEPSVLTKQIITAVTGTQTTNETRITAEQQPAPGPRAKEHKDPSLCINSGCPNVAVFVEFRGPQYCSNKCVIQHCRSEFQEWVSQRKLKT